MSHRKRRMATAAAVSGSLLLSALFVIAAGAADNKSGQSPAKVVIQSKGPGVPVGGTVAPLHLSEAQRVRIAGVLAAQDTEVDLQLKANKNAASFEPKIDEKIPKALKAQAFPLPLITEMPTIRRYEYLKFKGEVLVVNPLTGKIVDMFPEKNG